MGKSFLKDFSWYLLGSVIPIAIGIVKTPIFTSHFSKSDFGFLGIVSVTYTFLGMILFSWIGSCIWRYHPKFSKANQLKILYSNLFFIYVIAFFLLLIISAIWYYYEDNLLTKELIAYSFLNLVINQLFLFYMVIVRIEGKAGFYTIFQSIRALLSLAVVLFLVFKLHVNISALVSSMALIDCIAILFLVVVNPGKVALNFKLIEKQYLKELLIYGSAGLLINAGFLLISSSDRYIIAMLSTIDNVGIYDQVYKISQLSIAALVTIFFNTINPLLLNELEQNFAGSKNVMKHYLKIFLLYGFPLILYLSFFSKEIATIFLGVEFREGYTIMPYVFLATYILGIGNFYEMRLKFANKLKQLILIVLFATIFNIASTFLFVWLFNYKWAAITTVLTYLALVLAFHLLDKELFSYSSYSKKTVLKAVLVLFMQLVLFYVFSEYLSKNLVEKIILILVFILMYLFIFRNQYKKLKLPI